MQLFMNVRIFRAGILVADGKSEDREWLVDAYR
jgi:hypothetical protein